MVMLDLILKAGRTERVTQKALFLAAKVSMVIAEKAIFII